MVFTGIQIAIAPLGQIAQNLDISRTSMLASDSSKNIGTCLGKRPRKRGFNGKKNKKIFLGGALSDAHLY